MLDSLHFEKTSGPSWCIAWTAIPPACCWWRARRRRPPACRASLASRDASKIYWALVKGVPKEKRGVDQGGAGQGRRPRPAAATSAWRSSERRRRQIRPHRICRDGHGGPGIRLGGGAAGHRPHPPDPRASGQPGHAHRRRFQIWRHAMRAGKGDIADKLHLHARSIDIAPARWRAAAGHRAAAAAHAEELEVAGLRSRRQARSVSAEETEKRNEALLQRGVRSDAGETAAVSASCWTASR